MFEVRRKNGLVNESNLRASDFDWLMSIL